VPHRWRVRINQQYFNWKSTSRNTTRRQSSNLQYSKWIIAKSRCRVHSSDSSKACRKRYLQVVGLAMR